MKHVLNRLTAALFMSVLMCAGVFGQGTSQINGIVKDSTGAVLPGVEVKATQTETNQTRDGLTNETGAFTLGNLVAGPYTVEATLPGFKTFVRSGIIIGVDQNPTITIELEVGAVTEQVEVSANVTMVETRNLGIRQVIESEQILELPLNGRNATDLILLQGGAVADGGTSSTRALQGGVGVSVTGLANGSTTYMLDGALHTNPFDNLNLPVPFPDALGEFSVQSGSQNASSGFLGGAQVGAVTKSGTNDIHGDLFDFYRNDRFQARGYFASDKGSRTRNQFGGTIGAPIIKNKLFIFGGYQNTSNSASPTDADTTVPTARMLTGDFSELVKVYTNVADELGGCRDTPINNTGTGNTPGRLRLTEPGRDNFIDPSRFSKAALAIVKLLPQVNGMKDDPNGTNHLPLSLWADNKMQPGHSGPVGTDECGRVFYKNTTGSHDAQYIAKIDYQRSSTHSIFGRIFFTPQVTDIPALLEQDQLGFLNTAHLGTGGQDNLGSFYTIGDTYLFGPNTVNTLSLAVNRTAIHRIGPFGYDVNDVGINAFTYVPKNFYISLGTGVFGGNGGTNNEATNRTTMAQISDTVNMIRGSHQISFGGSLATWKIVSYANVRSVPTFTFTSTAGDLNSTGSVMADFLLGKFTSMRQATPNGVLVTQWYTALHGQDTWRLTPRFTLNAGVRWEPFFPQQQQDGHIYNFDYNKMLNNQRSQVFLNAPPGFTYPGDEGFPSKAGMQKNWKTIGPRIGFGWDPHGDGKMSVRASYGLSYNFVNGQFHFNTNIAPPFGNDTTVRPTNLATLDNPWADFPGGVGSKPGVSLFPYDNSTNNKNIPFAPGGVFLSLPYDQPTTYVQSWNLTFQRELPQSLFLSLQYSGNATRHIWNTYPLNPAIFVPGTGATNNGCMIPDGRGGQQSLLVASGAVATVALAKTSNTACSSTNNTEFRRILTLTRYDDVGRYAGALDTYEGGGNASYNGLVVSLRRQATRSLNVSGNYTWSHCISDPGGLTGMPNVNTGSTFVSVNGKDPTTPSTAFFDADGKLLPGVTSLTASQSHRDWNRQNCSSDRRQRLNTTVVAQTPTFANPILRAVATGWRISSIYTRSTGSYLEVGAGGDIARIGGGTSGQNALQLDSNPYSDGKPSGPRAQFLKSSTNLFVVPQNGELSPNHGQANIQGVPTWTWDASVARTFQVREGQRMEFRAEAYNVTNSFHPANPSTTIGTNFGLINTAAANSQRDMQFAIKYIF